MNGSSQYIPEKLIVVACSFYLTPEQIIKRIDRVFSKNSYYFGLIVSNRSSDHIGILPKCWGLILSDNSINDFSAYFKAIRHLKKMDNFHEYNILFLNDSLFTKHFYSISLNAISEKIRLLGMFNTPAMIGYKSNYTSICLHNPWSRANSFVPTYLFALNFSALQLFEELEDEYYHYVLPWLGGEFVKTLHAAESLRQLACFRAYEAYENRIGVSRQVNSERTNWILKKASCIYLEHRLSGVIGARGVMIFLNDGLKNHIKHIIFESVAIRKWIVLSALKRLGRLTNMFFFR